MLAALILLGRPVAAEDGPFAFVGAANCASTGCHGNAWSRDPRVWKKSSVLWQKNDPHQRAFDVLYAPRSVAMYDRIQGEPATSRSKIDPGEYLDFLESRCIGCHATPPPKEVRATTQASAAERAARYAAGVSCESCHGAAEKWLYEHYSVDWERRTVDDKSANFGFRSTRSLNDRPSVCIDCHVGPIDRGGPRFVVDHDLIAAGHPRLTFEFNSAQARLPAHWDAARDQQRHATAVNAAPNRRSYHFDAWLAGQQQVSLALGLNQRRKDKSSEDYSDFARFDCQDCHHELRGDNWRRSTTWPSRTFLPRQSLLKFSEFVADNEIAFTPTARTELLIRLSNPLDALEGRTWDSLVSWDLALRAWLADRHDRPPSSLSRAIDEFDQALVACFDTDRPTLYHTPTRFRPDEAKWMELVRKIREELHAWQD